MYISNRSVRVNQRVTVKHKQGNKQANILIECFTRRPQKTSVLSSQPTLLVTYG